MTIVPPTSAFPVVVTGASRGIDAETAILLAARGYRVAVNYMAMGGLCMWRAAWLAALPRG